MGLQTSASVIEGGTGSVTGGTAKTYSPDGLMVTGGLHIADLSVTDIRTRPSITVKNSPASVDAKTGVWSDGKREVTCTRPKILASGVQKFPNIRIMVKDHPEMSQAEIDAMWLMVAVVATHADFAAFRRTGSLA